MADCRCSDMARCSRDISKLDKVLWKKSNLDMLREMVHTELEAIATKSMSSLTYDNLVGLGLSIKHLDGELQARIGWFYQEMSGRRLAIQSAYAEMKAEDEAYHEEVRIAMLQAAREAKEQQNI